MSSVVVEDNNKPVPPTPVHKEAFGISKLKDYKQLHPYVLRSYKVMLLFCDDRNYRDMIQAFPLIIGRFCKHKFFSILLTLVSPRASQKHDNKKRFDV